MKTRQIIGALVAITGIFTAVSVADGSSYEIAIRLNGVAMLFIGGIVGKFFDVCSGTETAGNGDEDENGYSKKNDHNPYPEE